MLGFNNSFEPKPLRDLIQALDLMGESCYLCGLPINNSHASGDHAVPATLITRAQPKVKGFNYAGKLPTHPECNNRFGPEIYVAKALGLLELLESEDGTAVYQHRNHPEITIQALDASKLPNFTRKDLAFFKFIDVREADYPDWSKPEFFSGKQRTNPKRDAIYIAMSVLAKSAAALLIKNKLQSVPMAWRIYAIPYSGATDQLDFDHIVGPTEPFDVGIKVWLGQLDNTDWLAIYRAKSIVIFFVFVFAPHNALGAIRPHFPDADIFEFTGSCLNDLLTAGWHKV
jgi:hypothetical protein